MSELGTQARAKKEGGLLDKFNFWEEMSSPGVGENYEKNDNLLSSDVIVFQHILSNTSSWSCIQDIRDYQKDSYFDDKQTAPSFGRRCPALASEKTKKIMTTCHQQMFASYVIWGSDWKVLKHQIFNLNTLRSSSSSLLCVIIFDKEKNK